MESFKCQNCSKDLKNYKFKYCFMCSKERKKLYINKCDKCDTMCKEGFKLCYNCNLIESQKKCESVIEEEDW